MQVDLAEFRDLFFEEALEHIEVLEGLACNLVAAPDDFENIDRMFRTIHSVKGAATSFGIDQVVDYSHHVENLLDSMRSGQRSLTSEVVDLMVCALDTLGTVVEYAKKDKSTTDVTADIVSKLKQATANAVDVVTSTSPTSTVPAVLFSADEGLVAEFLEESAEHLDSAESILLEVGAGVAGPEDVGALYRAFHSIKGVAGFLGLDDIHSVTHAVETLFDNARSGSLRVQGSITDTVLACIDAIRNQTSLVEEWLEHQGKLKRDVTLESILLDLSKAAEASPSDEADSPSIASLDSTATPAKHRSVSHENIKVDRERLDQLINVIGELVIAESMVQIEFDDHQMTSRSLPELHKIARELQDLSLSLRMVPVRGIFQKMSRIARDVARKVNKRVSLRFEGEDTELDKSMVDQVSDPLVHMVRNAVDHGLETAEERVAAGKSPEGLLVLRAYHKDGSVCIELEDDGRGLDRDAICRKAIESGLLQEGNDLPDRDIYNLIFEPGFSTAKAVTDISGRGVGMDVVRKNIEAMQGYAQISSLPGEGATFSMCLPLTLAIVDGLLVQVSDNTYVIPITAVSESLRPAEADIRRFAGRGEILFLRGESIPIVRLHEVFQVETEIHNPSDGLLVIIKNRDKRMALFVGRLVNQQQVVMKSLEANYEQVDGVSGATILGDGGVALIVDTAAIHRIALVH